ncbi:hypothetical protein EZS27_000373 [termite gut metagenome]|uniref:Uncharacterized protein n=1 Tax=termite gut metagenome TaxID=433724 RepID=A0A5J4T3E1_9ZZZZ
MTITFPPGSYRGHIENMAAYVRCGRQVFRSINNRYANSRIFSQMQHYSRYNL